MRVRTSVRAAASIRPAIAYYRQHSPQTVETFKADMRACRARLSEHPHSARITSEDGVRVSLLRRCPYLVHHETTDDAVLLIDGHHAARERPT